jgi:hypothetical protein
MSPDIPYSRRKEDLFYPCRNAQFFPAGASSTETALCAELARLAYCRREPNFEFAAEKIKDVLRRVRFTDCEFFESSKERGEGFHCFLAVRDDRQLAVVAFRGTDKEDPTDLVADADAFPSHWQGEGKVHEGFAAALAELEPRLSDRLKSVQCRLVFTGHSLGAAMATLMASLHQPDALFTIGSPLVGDAAFLATLSNLENHRFVDCCDLVTRVPPEILGYRHLGKPTYIAENRQVIFDPGDEFISHDRLRASEAYLLHHTLEFGTVAVRELADHAPMNYVLPLTAQA